MGPPFAHEVKENIPHATLEHQLNILTTFCVHTLCTPFASPHPVAQIGTLLQNRNMPQTPLLC